MNNNTGSMKLNDTSSFASNQSFLGSQNNTTVSKPEKNNTDSVLTLGPETQRKNVIETTRSMCEIEDEEKKDTEPTKDPLSKKQINIEMEISYSQTSRSDSTSTVLKQHLDDSYAKKIVMTNDTHTQEDLLNNAQIDESMYENPPLKEMNISHPNNRMINPVKVNKDEPNYLKAISTLP